MSTPEEASEALMQSCEAASEDATMEGFAQTQYADRVDRFTRTVYRMGFESGWRIHEKQAAALRAQPEAAAQPAQPVAESWWLMESTVTPRPLFYAGHNKHSDGALKPTMTENAAQAVRFPDEWTAKYTLAHLLGIDVSGPRWPFAFMNFGYAVREHIFDYTPRALASPPPSPKTGEGSAIEGRDSGSRASDETRNKGGRDGR